MRFYARPEAPRPVSFRTVAIAAGLPFVCALALFRLFRRPGGPLGPAPGIRASLLSAAVASGAILVAITEASSALRALTPASVASGWIAASLLALAAARRKGRPPDPRSAGRRLRVFLRPRRALLAAGLAAAGASTLALAVAVPPNNYDSMTYHLPRVAHWIQDRTVAFYPTHSLRQLYSGPGAEYAICHLGILAGSDRLANAVQWIAWAGAAVAASEIARLLGARVRGQLATAVFAATLPGGILEATTTQNDLVASFWICAFAALSLRALRRPAERFLPFGAALALGLALLTKPTAWVHAPPLLLGLLLGLLRRDGPRGLRTFALLLALAGLVPGLHLSRNARLYATPWGTYESYPVEDRSPPSLVSNLVRNAALHLQTPWEPLNRRVEAAALAFHGTIGRNPNDRRTTTRGQSFRLPGLRFNEDMTGNPLHFLSIVLAALLVPARRRTRRLLPLAYLAAVGAGALLFCGSAQWNPWNVRLHLPAFLLAAPLPALALRGVAPRGAAGAGLALLLALSGVWIAKNERKPLSGPRSVFRSSRLNLAFRSRPDLQAPLMAAAELLRREGCRRIGIVFGKDDPEYLLWTVLDAAPGGDTRIDHVAVQNPSAFIHDELRPPDAVVSLNDPALVPRWFAVPISPPREFGPVQVWVRSVPLPARALRAALAFASPPPASAAAGGEAVYRVRVSNLGPAVFPARPWAPDGSGSVRLACRVQRPGRLAPIWEGRGKWLPGDLRPGGEAIVEARVPLPREAGDYEVRFDLVHEGLRWFSAAGNPVLAARVRIE